MDNSPFGRLSSELRNQIYEFALTGPWPCVHLETISNYNGLTRTCKQIRAETLEMFYSQQNFKAIVRARNLQGFCAFLRAVGPDALSCVRSLEFRIIDVLPCARGALQCSHTIEILGLGHEGQIDAKYYSIRAKGVESVVCETLLDLGLELKGLGSVNYIGKGPVWFAWKRQSLTASANTNEESA